MGWYQRRVHGERKIVGPSPLTMRTLLVNMVILTIASVSQIDAGCEIGKVTNKDIKKLFEPYTVLKPNGKPKNDSPCWWDLTRKNCGTCKKGGKQCGYPMHKWCQSPKSKKGCKGIPNYKYTLSTEGAPCYFDHKNHKCAWCTKKSLKQCSQKNLAQIDDGCYSYCGTAKDRNCDGNLFNCIYNGGWCGQGASCSNKIKTSSGCSCNAEYIGNGFQCFSGDCDAGNCTLVPDPADNVKVNIDTQSEFFVYAVGSGSSTEL